MGDHDKKHDRPEAADEDRGVGGDTQSQGGIGPRAAQRAREEADPAAGLPGGPLGRAEPQDLSLDQGGGERPADGRAHAGFSGDDAPHRASDSRAYPPTLQAGPSADLGPEQDQRLHGMPADPAERTTGSDRPNRGKPGSGAAGAAGGPAKTAPSRLPGQEADEGVSGGPHSRNDGERDPQI